MRAADQVPCLICGKGTQSASGYCATPGPCKRAQHATMVRATRAAERGPSPIDTALDNYVDELLAEFVAV